MDIIRPSFAIGHSMIGMSVLLFPIYALKLGYIPIIVTTLCFGVFNTYTVMLVLQHRGNCKNNQEIVAAHFDNPRPLKILNDLAIVCLYGGTCLSFFQAGAIQIQNLLSSTDLVSYAPYILFSLILLMSLILTVTKTTQDCVALGFLVIISFLIFILWAFITAPSGINRIQPISSLDVFQYCAIMMFAFSSHQIVLPLLYRTTTPDKFQISTIIGFVLAVVVSLYNALAGGFAIVNRQVQAENFVTIENYFPANNWEVQYIEVIFILHILSAGPYFQKFFILYCKLMFGIDQSQKLIPLDLFLVILVWIVCLLITLLKVKLSTVLSLSGALGGMVAIFVFPIIIHCKCKYFPEQSHSYQPQNDQEQQNQDKKLTFCNYHSQPQSKFQNVMEILWIILILAIALLVSEESIRKLF